MAKFWGAIVLILIVGLLAGLSVDQLGLMIGNGINGFFNFVSSVIQGVSN